MLACTHQRRGALIILEIDLRPLCQECLHHVHPAMAHSEHQSCLTGLGSRRQESNTGRNRASNTESHITYKDTVSRRLGKGKKMSGTVKLVQLFILSYIDSLNFN